MCGIAGIIPKTKSSSSHLRSLAAMSESIAHRGPDGEGFLVAGQGYSSPCSRAVPKTSNSSINYLPLKRLEEHNTEFTVAFAHRRLSIIDLSDTGHQPMCSAEQDLWITYNGELYNYRELRESLIAKGHRFVSQSDTEVILMAYKEWGRNCVTRFNGMWAFCIYDAKNSICFGSRDRLGVKPFYYVDHNEHFVFASEQKAFARSGLIKARASEKALSNYLQHGLLEDGEENFFEGIRELFPGHNLTFDLSQKNLSIATYFDSEELPDLKNESLSDGELTDKIRDAVTRSVQLRMRSDVEVGTCLSGGIDSSILAVTMAQFSRSPIHCFTSVFRNSNINEEKYADATAQKIKAIHHKTEPGLGDFMKEVDELVYSQDVPIWSTSTYAQHKVMALARNNNIKVVLDGQGADEVFAGYHHHFIAKWKNLLSTGSFASTWSDMRASARSIPNPLEFFLKQLTKEKLSLEHLASKKFLAPDFAHLAADNELYFYSDLNLQLLDDLGYRRLKIFLKCEDRCGMWHGVESRTPFSDDPELLDLAFSFDPNRKIQNGTSKYLLREAMKHSLPAEIYARNDKMGFETPMADWVNQVKGQMFDEIVSAQLPYVNKKKLEKIDLRRRQELSFFFKLFVLSRWQKVFV